MVERAYPNYDDVLRVDSLPRQVQTSDRKIAHGYAVELSGSIDQCWIFFSDLEPALVFGRAGRMSSIDIRSYGVFRAARDLRYDEQRRADVVTLFITGDNLDRQQDEGKWFKRWLAGTTLDSSRFQPPTRR